MARAIILMLFAVLGATTILDAQQKDKIFMKDGQILTGTLVDPDFLFDTIYGKVRVPNAAVQKIERQGEKTEVLNTVNNEVITGFIANENLRLQISNGPVLEVRKELVSKIVFAPRETRRLQMKDYFMMKNGDVFYGSVSDESFRFTTSYGTMDTSFASLLKLEDVDGQTRMYLSDGNTVMGYIDTNYINIRSNYGFSMRLPKSSIKLVQMREK